MTPDLESVKLGVVLKDVTTPVYQNLSPCFQRKAVRYYPAYRSPSNISPQLSLPKNAPRDSIFGASLDHSVINLDHLLQLDAETVVHQIAETRLSHDDDDDDDAEEHDVDDEEEDDDGDDLFVDNSMATTSSDDNQTTVNSVAAQISWTCDASREALRELRRRMIRLRRCSLNLSSASPGGQFVEDTTEERTRRLSMPHPIKQRHRKHPPSIRQHGRRSLQRSQSAPQLSSPHPTPSRLQRDALKLSSPEAGDLAVQPDYCALDDDDDVTESDVSHRRNDFKTTRVVEMFGEQPVMAEALWDHVTMDPEELCLRAGQDVQVLDMRDAHWWYGRQGAGQGWFPALFVRLRAIQADTTEDLAKKIKDGTLDSDTARRRYSCNNILSKDEARSNVVREIVTAERDYVKHLSDIVEGYIVTAKNRPNMFPETRLKTLFGNIEEIYEFSQVFLADLEKCYKDTDPRQSELGACFTRHSEGFEVYSEYCNNHPSATEELRILRSDRRYILFFECCQRLQDMIQIPLDGFLLTPVQKICKYPLQLKELLKHTKPQHPDYEAIQGALASMQKIALLINERKRKIESLEQLVLWQEKISHWEGADLIDSSSELIHSGEMVKINRKGTHQERVFFLFDHQLIYCKKDNLRRDELIYRGRINIDHCRLQPVVDGKDPKLGIVLHNALRMELTNQDKSYLLYCKELSMLQAWYKAFSAERKQVRTDADNGFIVKDFCDKMEPLLTNRLNRNTKHRGNKLRHKGTVRHLAQQHSTVSSRQHRNVTTTQYPSNHHHLEKKGWFTFRNKKTTRTEDK